MEQGQFLKIKHLIWIAYSINNFPMTTAYLCISSL